MKKVMFVLGIGLILCGMLAGCKKKSDEEKVGELLEKATEAKSEKEAKRIEEKIEQLTQKQRKEEKKSTKEVIIKLGQPFNIWCRTAYGARDSTQFSMTFEEVATANEDVVGKQEKGKKYLMVLAEVKNLGPRKTYLTPSGDDIQAKTDKGYLYRMSGYPSSSYAPFPRKPPCPYDWRAGEHLFRGESTEGLEPEKRGWIIYWAALPENAAPAELLAQFPTEEWQVGGAGKTTFQLKLGQLPEESDTDEKEPAPSASKVSSDALVGTYTFSGKYLELKADGSCSLSESTSDDVSQGKWKIIPILRPWGYIEDDAIVVGGEKLWIKQNEARLIMRTDSGENIWSEYSQPENSYHLELDKNGKFKKFLKGNWRIEADNVSMTLLDSAEKPVTFSARIDADKLASAHEGDLAVKAQDATIIKKTASGTLWSNYTVPNTPLSLEFEKDSTLIQTFDDGNWMVSSGILCQFADKTWRAEIETDGYMTSLVGENGYWEKQRQSRISRPAPSSTGQRQEDTSRSRRRIRR